MARKMAGKEVMKMATKKEYLDFVLDQLSGLSEITYRMMMGEYIIYYRGKIAAYLCDDRLLVKPVPKTKELLPSAPLEPPYEGAKDMVLMEDIDDREFLEELFLAMYDELPAPKKRNKDNPCGETIRAKKEMPWHLILRKSIRNFTCRRKNRVL